MRRGFTIIELLVVVAIIGILATIIVPSMDGARKKGRDSTRISDIKGLQLGLEVYFESGNNTYPATLSVLAPSYIPTVPKDPSTGLNYYYAQTNGGDGYHLGALLEVFNETLSNDSDATTTNFGGASTDCVNAGITVASTERCLDYSIQ